MTPSAVHAMTRSSRNYLRSRQRAAATAVVMSRGTLPEALPRGLVERLEDLQRKLGHCEGRLELTQVVETILRKQLKWESERAERLEEKLREAEATLYRARRGWFKHFFGIGE